MVPRPARNFHSDTKFRPCTRNIRVLSLHASIVGKRAPWRIRGGLSGDTLRSMSKRPCPLMLGRSVPSQIWSVSSPILMITSGGDETHVIITCSKRAGLASWGEALSSLFQVLLGPRAFFVLQQIGTLANSLYITASISRGLWPLQPCLRRIATVPRPNPPKAEQSRSLSWTQTADAQEPGP